MKLTATSTIKAHKKKIIIASSIAFALLIGIYGVVSYSSWSNYTARYEVWYKKVQTQLDASRSLKDETDHVTVLKKASETMAANKDICTVHFFVGWQATLLPALRSQQEKCSLIARQIGILNGKTNNVVTYLEDEQALVKILAAPDLKVAQVGEGDFSAQVANWETVSKKIQNTPVSSKFTSIKTEAYKSALAISQGWQQLVGANTAKDRTKYNEAVARIGTTYGLLSSSVSDLNERQYQATLQEFQSAYDKTF